MTTDTEVLNAETYELLLEVGRRLAKAQSLAENAGYNSRLAGEVVKHGKAVAMFSAELRKANAGVDEAAKKLSQDEKIAVAERWLSRLPPVLLRPAIERLKAFLRKRP